jgi:ATP-binding cassette subfamily F protein 3
MLSKDILKNALIQYDGTLIIVSHDRDFLQGLTNKVYEFRKPHIKEYIGDIYDFLEQKNLNHLKELEMAAKQQTQKAAEPVSQNKINYERKKQIDAKLRKVDKEIQRLETAISKLEAELAEQDAIMANPAEHPEVKVDNDWYWAYGKKKEELQALLDDWGEKQMEREEVMAEYGA